MIAQADYPIEYNFADLSYPLRRVSAIMLLKLDPDLWTVKDLWTIDPLRMENGP